MTCPRTGETDRVVVDNLLTLRERMLLDHLVDSLVLFKKEGIGGKVFVPPISRAIDITSGREGEVTI